VGGIADPIDPTKGRRFLYYLLTDVTHVRLCGFCAM
jgi:hypothetical protein